MLAVAPSAVAGQLLYGGLKTPSEFKITIFVTFESTCDIDVSSQIADDLKETSFIVSDEIVLSHFHNLDAVDCTLSYIL